MNMKLSSLGIVVILGLATLACNLGASPETQEPGENDPNSVRQTVEAEITQTAAANAAAGDEQSQEEAATATPITTAPIVLVSVDTNCRSGPGEAYEYAGALLEGEEGEIVAQSAVDNYALIKNPDGEGDCWLWLQFGSVEGELNGLPVATQPPPPTATPFPELWAGTWEMTDEVLSYSATIIQDERSISANFTYDNLNVTISGTVSADGRRVTGTWNNGSDNGAFTWVLVGENQFNGKGDEGNPPNDNFPWCGYRNGAGFPSPCELP